MSIVQMFTFVLALCSTVESIHTFAMEGNLAGLGQLFDSGTAVDLKGA